MTKAYFTITAGRTGTAWLSEFISKNLNIEVIHEPLGMNDFGVKMPDIRTLRNFNNLGNNTLVQDFWKMKFAIIRGDIYAETNHTLAKCGLVENLLSSSLVDDVTLISLRRNIVKQCVSYLVRHDFGNITLAWQWYLHPTYLKKIVNPQWFLNKGQMGVALWYCYEMSARQAYYKLKYGDKLKIIEIELEKVVHNAGANNFWHEIGGLGDCVLPPPKNQNQAQPTEQLIEQVTHITSSINFDAEEMAYTAIKNGFTFEAA